MMAAMGGGDMGGMPGMPGMGARSPEDHKQEVAALKAVRSLFYSFIFFFLRRFFFSFFNFSWEIRVAPACPGYEYVFFFTCFVFLAAGYIRVFLFSFFAGHSRASRGAFLLGVSGDYFFQPYFSTPPPFRGKTTYQVHPSIAAPSI